jgi:hypothetical protein
LELRSLVADSAFSALIQASADEAAAWKRPQTRRAKAPFLSAALVQRLSKEALINLLP